MNKVQPTLRNYFIVYCIMWVLWMVLHFLILKNNDISIFAATADSLISNILLFFFCIVLSNILRYYQPGRNSSKYLLIWCLVFSFFWFLITLSVIPVLLRSDILFVRIFKSSLLLRFVFANFFIGGSILLMWVWQNYKNQHEENLRHLQLLQLVKESELYNLRQQLQPHFLFNSLNSISALAGTQPEKARQMIHQLSEFLRGTIKKDESLLVQFTDELTNARLYLEIEKVRFGHRLSVDFNIDPDCLEILMPPLVLQPIIENAIKFGLYDTLESVTIYIRAKVKEKNLLIDVSNPFDQNNFSSKKGVGFGLSSLKRRLFLLYNRSDLLKTSAESHIFTCRLIIPHI